MRAAFAVAASRAVEVVNQPDSLTLWRLPVEIEDQIEDAWARLLETPEPWKQFLTDLEQYSGCGLLAVLTKRDLLSPSTAERVGKRRRADELRSVPVKAAGESVEELFAILSC